AAAMWTRLAELFGGRPRPVVNVRSYIAAVAVVQQLAASASPADQDAAYRTVLAITAWLHREVRRSHEPTQRILRASALEQWELTAEQLKRPPVGREAL